MDCTINGSSPYICGGTKSERYIESNPFFQDLIHFFRRYQNLGLPIFTEKVDFYMWVFIFLIPLVIRDVFQYWNK